MSYFEILEGHIIKGVNLFFVVRRKQVRPRDENYLKVPSLHVGDFQIWKCLVIETSPQCE